MILLDGSFVYSATDLSGFLACEHLLSLDRDAATGAPARRDDPGGLAARYGHEHEATYLASLRARGLRVAELVRPALSRADLSAAQDATRSALAEGFDVVYQGTFFDGNWLGHPDFLVRRDWAGGRWQHAYDVVDTKLARHAKATALLQVALYGEMLTAVQGCEPRELIFALGDGSEERFPYGAVASYLRAIKIRFGAALCAPPPYPYPVEHCDVCMWDEHCTDRRHRDDHLSLVAGIRRRQVMRLEDSGLGTLSAFATAPAQPTGTGIGSGSLVRLRRQASEQLRSREAGALTYSPLPALPGQGLDTLPAPDPGDVFFDVEGFPYAEDGGLEYLFGWADCEGSFSHLFAEDRAGERRAFERFMDELAERRRQHPGMRVYHYASYEKTALSRLSNRHGVREEEVADLLRDGVLVDLYRVVRQSVVVGAESYSIKYLEPLYGVERTGDVRNAAESLEMYQAWLDSEPRDDTIRDHIAAYNEVDCVSTLRLRDWLLGLRGTTAQAGEPNEFAGDEQVRPLSERFSSWLTLAESAAEALMHDLPEDPTERDPEQQGRAVLAHLLKFHQREDNAQWRDFFSRMELSVDDLRDGDGVAVGDLRYEGPGQKVKQSQDYRYSFPAQDVALRVGDHPIDPATGSSPGQLVGIEAAGEHDPERGLLVLRRRATTEAPHPNALIPQGVVDDYVLRHALARLAEWVAANGLGSPAPEWRAARQLLMRHPPRVVGATLDGPLALPGEHGSDALLRIAPLLDGAVLPVQGPPGSGKSYSAAHVIIDAVGSGQRVAVTANSHRVVEHLLATVVEENTKLGKTARIAHKTDADDEVIPGVVNVRTNEGVVALLDRREVDVVGGTVWLMSRPEMAGSFDLVVVDEAGQVSLANALASMGAARNAVLVGDPAQLDQPIQAAHPEATDASALAHLIGEAATMPEHLGLFLERTRRMHPSICRFVSEVVYDGKLSGIDGLERQSVAPRTPQTGKPPGERLAGSGIRWLPVAHEGNRTSSVEEAERVASAVGELLGGAWSDTDGVEHPLGPGDILVVTPYNAQIATLRTHLPIGLEVGTVDKFQGREAPIVIYSMATSGTEDLPRDFEFLFSLNRLNVAVSRAMALAVLVCSPALRAPRCRTTRQIRLVNALCRLIEFADETGGSPA